MAKNKKNYPKHIREDVESDMHTLKLVKGAISDIGVYYTNLKKLGDIENPVGNIEMQLKMVTDALNMKMQVLGEELPKFSEAFKNFYLRGVHISNLTRVRNTISHQYEAVNMRLIKGLIEMFIPDIQYGIEMFELDEANDNPYQYKEKNE